MGKPKHGLSTNPDTIKIYRAWCDIKQRCYNPNNKFYCDYGGRGIFIQQDWINNPKAFFEYVNSLTQNGENLSIDRIDNNLSYVSGNLRWATKGQQVRNRSKNTNNTSGTCGVTWYYNKTGGTRAIAWWYEGEHVKSKSFPEKKFGLLPAFQMAHNYRQSMIAKLNSQGYDYTPNHGK